jgi:4-hydroxy-3-polyprenylbenzoate decarboxylase
MVTTRRLVVGLTGERGASYGVRILELLHPTPVETHVVMCACVRRGLPAETGRAAADVLALADHTYGEWNQAARISSGSFLTLGMVVAPCSERSLGSIALGYANTLIHRAADVTMKEGRPLELLVAADSLADANARHVDLLGQVPGVRLRASRAGDTPEAVDALVVDVLGGFGISLPASA